MQKNSLLKAIVFIYTSEFLQKKYKDLFMVNQKKLVVKAFLLMFVFCGATSLFANKSKKKQPEQLDNYRARIGNLDLSRSFVEDSAKDHPYLFAGTIASLIALQLYPYEINDFVKNYRNAICGVSMTSLALLLCNKKRIFKNIFGENDSAFISIQADEDDDNIFNFSKCDVRIFRSGQLNTKFKDVAGLETAKEDLNDILQFLKDPKKFVEIGAKIPKGVLLFGTPGNGKTLLARALAGESQCPFLYVNASEFMQAMVGIGAARVRHLFSVAKELAPCIIFIDEIDAVGKKRSSHGMGGDTELAQTLNQLLAEMDGFEQSTNPIIIIGATNREDVLDEALLRPGRFDRKVEIRSPLKNDRFKILKVIGSKIKLDNNIDFEKIAYGTQGFSGADLAKLMNEAAILAVRQGDKIVTMYHIDAARDYILLGRETKGMDISKEDFWKTAVHESGHAIARVYQSNAMPLYKVTITPRGGALGLTFGMNIKERYNMFQEEMRAEIVVMLAGSVAEEVIFGGRGAGACSDLSQARALATQMVMHYGITDEFKDVTFFEFIHNQVHLPDEISTKLHKEVAKIIKECRAIASDIVISHKDNLTKLVDMLMDHGTVFGRDVYELCGIADPGISYSLSE